MDMRAYINQKRRKDRENIIIQGDQNNLAPKQVVSRKKLEERIQTLAEELKE